MSPIQSHIIDACFSAPQPTTSSHSQLFSGCHKPCQLQLSDDFLYHLSSWKSGSYSSGIPKEKPNHHSPTPPPPIISVLNLVEQLSCCQYSFANQLVLSPVNVLPELHKERKWIYIRAGPSTSVIICKGNKGQQGEKNRSKFFSCKQDLFPPFSVHRPGCDGALSNLV